MILFTANIFQKHLISLNLGEKLLKRNEAHGKFKAYVYKEFGHLLLYIYSTSNNLYIPHTSPIMISVINEIFIEVIQYEMQLAFYLYFKQNNAAVQKEHAFIMRLMNTRKKIIAVHWRCGDLMKKKIRTKKKFPGISFYNKSFKALNLSNNDGTSNFVVYWISQLDETKARRLDKPWIEKCNKIMNAMKPYYSQIFFKNEDDDFITVPNGTINTDSFLLSHADYSIGGTSSFYSMLTLGNPNSIESIWTAPDLLSSVQPKNRIFVERYGSVIGDKESVMEIVQYVIPSAQESDTSFIRILCGSTNTAWRKSNVCRLCGETAIGTMHLLANCNYIRYSFGITNNYGSDTGLSNTQDIYRLLTWLTAKNIIL
eukprot:673609_1